MYPGEQWLYFNFDFISQLFQVIGINSLDRNYRICWRTGYIGSVILFAMVQLSYMVWMERSNLEGLFVVLPYFLFATQSIHSVMLSTRRSGEIFELWTKLSEIQRMLMESESNGPIIRDVFKISRFIQKLIAVLYFISGAFVVFAPLVVWLIRGTRILLFPFFVPGFDASTTAGFLLCIGLHAYIMPSAFCFYTGHECMFLGFLMPVKAYVDSLANEIQELNSIIKDPKPDQTNIRNKLNRIVKIHQLLNEYEAMLEDLYNILTLNKVGLIYVGIICTIVVILKSSDLLAFIFFSLMFVQLTQGCLMGTIVTVKNEHLLGHIYDIEWYHLATDQAKQVGFMLLQAQNPTSVTIGNYAPLNVESYYALLESIFSYVMVMITFLE